MAGPLKESLSGKNITSHNKLLSDLRSCCAGNYSAKAALDMAVYDALAQAYSLPLCQLLGGDPSTILSSDITLTLDEPSTMAENAVRNLNNGFNLFKMKVGIDPLKDIERVLAVHHACPEGVTFRLDADQGWTPKEAIRVISRLEKEGVPLAFVEQPVRKNDISGLPHIRNSVLTPIMADESLNTVEDAIHLINAEAVDMFNIKLMKCGGIKAAMEIASIAQVKNIPCMIGCMLETTASIYASVCTAIAHPNITMIDLDSPLWFMEKSSTDKDYCNNLPFIYSRESRGQS